MEKNDNNRMNFLKNLAWKKMNHDEVKQTLQNLLSSEGEKFDAKHLEGFSFEGDRAQLGFYKKHQLINITILSSDGQKRRSLYALQNSECQSRVLDGSSEPVHSVNELEDLKLSSEEGPNYIRFFCFAVRGTYPFCLLEEKPENYNTQDPKILDLYKPLSYVGKTDEGFYHFEVNMIYDRTACHVDFHLESNGTMTMGDDNPILNIFDKKAIPSLPSLYKIDVLERLICGSHKPAHIILVELLLEKALIEQSENRLFQLFNSMHENEGPLKRFSALLTKAFPVVIIESHLPFVEEAILEIIRGLDVSFAKFKTIKGIIQNDVNNIENITLDLPLSGPALALIPLQDNQKLLNHDRIVYELSTRDISTIISCQNIKSIPENLRSICDVFLKLPAIDSNIFQTYFEIVMGGPLPNEWQEDDNIWVKYVMPVDFEHPERMGLDLEKAFQFIKTQVTEKLATIDPESATGLKDLHGLGEARQFAEDLIADISAAVQGQIRWSEVDRGALLVGAPGTGKTTLARAIAKDCGVKFIQTSATQWMAASDSLGPHIREIRKVFSEARRYAPSILFIDEIDSLGSREKSTGQNDGYFTNVINAVLELIQGIELEAPVIILGATNHEDRVDPAIRRSGRMDRVINIPLPSSESLTKIYEYYLSLIADEQDLDASIHTKTIAGMSLGLTGADVERIVRGASRRARKERRSINQNDLMAEVTGKPRSEEGVPRMSREEQERTAWHESGHALALYLSESQTTEIGFVSIIPRSDGTLGFVASLPDERLSLTRKDYMERLEFLMAGRAAEEVKFGEENISSGAANDLKNASQIAVKMVTNYGLGNNHKLLWIEKPGEKEFSEANSLLHDAYNSVLKKIKKNRPLLEVLVKELLLKQELTGEEVRNIFAGEKIP